MSELDDLLDLLEGAYQEPSWLRLTQRHIYQDMDIDARLGCEEALHDRGTYEEETG